jgi:two-component system, NarL family, response regulator LiaR
MPGAMPVVPAGAARAMPGAMPVVPAGAARAMPGGMPAGAVPGVGAALDVTPAMNVVGCMCRCTTRTLRPNGRCGRRQEQRESHRERARQEPYEGKGRCGAGRIHASAVGSTRWALQSHLVPWTHSGRFSVGVRSSSGQPRGTGRASSVCPKAYPGSKTHPGRPLPTSAHDFSLFYFAPVQAASNALRVVLVDDHHLFRSGLRGMLEADGMSVVGETTNGARAVRLVLEMTPDVTIVDLKMPDVSGMKAIQGIVAEAPEARLLVLTVSAKESDVIEALAAGARGYLLKDTHPDELVRGTRLVANGHAVLSGDVARTLASSRKKSQAAEVAAHDGLALTARELEVLRLIAEGADNATIGRELSISKHTVKQYVANLFEKLGVSGRVQAAVYAVRKGLV